MNRRRFFVEGIHHPSEIVSIEGTDAHHIADVLHLRAGDRIEIVDSGGRAFVAEIAGDARHLRARLVEERPRTVRSRLRIDVAQAMPKGSKMDEVIEKATELGAALVLPFWSERTIARSVGVEKLERWRRIARSASEQSGRREIPSVLEPAAFTEVLARFCAYDLVLFAWEGSNGVPLRNRLPQLLARADSALVVIGPEGGFSHAESEAARVRGAQIVSLGERILRTETAAPALLAVLNYEYEGRNEARSRRIKNG
jgi:16S rRNA (uracil1498-N3)-methyltransferase